MKIATELKICLVAGALLVVLTACESRTNPKNQPDAEKKENPTGTYATPTPHEAGIPPTSPRPAGSPTGSPQK